MRRLIDCEADEHTEPVSFHGAKRRFVGEVVAEVSGGAGAGLSSFFKDGGHCSAFVAARAQLETGFEFEEVEAIHPGHWFK